MSQDESTEEAGTNCCKSTPGHGGKVCAEWSKLDVPYRPLDRLLWKNTADHWFYCGYVVCCCPACGIRLVPDPESLPVCNMEHHPTILRLEGWVRIECYIRSPAGIVSCCTVQRPTEIEAREVWHRAFGKGV